MCKILEQYSDLVPWLGQQLRDGLKYVEIFATANETAARSPCSDVPTEDFLHILTCHVEAGTSEYLCEHRWPELSHKLLEFISENAAEVMFGSMSALDYYLGKVDIIGRWLKGEGSEL